MASNSFGDIFRITTFGESHGKALGVVIDGCPAGLSLTADEINDFLKLRQGGKSDYVSPRKEQDKGEIISGIFAGKTTGMPIAIIIRNRNIDSGKYEPIKNLLRPGHANYTYLQKYGIFDYRGGGRASARETVCRVAAGAVAKKILEKHKVKTAAFVKTIGNIAAKTAIKNIVKLRKQTYQNAIFCPDEKAAQLMMQEIDKVKNEGDSIGGIVEFIASGLPTGLGDPVYKKLDAVLAKAMMSIPASKGFEIGEGFNAVHMKGSEHNDIFPLETNHAGGLLGGISTGMPLIGRVAFKPTASIAKPQKTTDLKGKEKIFKLPKGSKHDPCVAIRAVPVVEAMLALVIADMLCKNERNNY